MDYCERDEVDRCTLRRAVTSCIVAHDPLTGRLRAVVAIGRTNFDRTDVTVAEARAPQARASLDVGGALVVAAELSRAMLGDR